MANDKIAYYDVLTVPVHFEIGGEWFKSGTNRYTNKELSSDLLENPEYVKKVTLREISTVRYKNKELAIELIKHPYSIDRFEKIGAGKIVEAERK